MLNKTFALTFILFLGLSFGNCNQDDCGDLPEWLPFFDVQSMGPIEHISLTDGQPAQVISQNTFVKNEDYAGMRIQFDVDFIAQQETSRQWHFSLMNSALACSPVPNGTEGSKNENFKSLEVITKYDFDDNHLANSDINDLLNIQGEGVYGNVEAAEDMNEFLTKNESLKFPTYFLSLKSAPVATDSFQVNILIELSTGEKFEAETDLIRVTE